MDKELMEKCRHLICGTVNGDLRSCSKDWCDRCSFRLPRLDEALTRAIPIIRKAVEAERLDRPDREKIEESLLSDELLEIGRKAIEDTLIEWRDSHLSEFNRGNGLVIREKDGGDSNIIRFGPETALRIGMKAMLKHAQFLALIPDKAETRKAIASEMCSKCLREDWIQKHVYLSENIEPSGEDTEEER